MISKGWSGPVLLCYMAVILVLSLTPGEGSSGSLTGWVSPGLQNLMHIPAFGILALLMAGTLQLRGFRENQCILMAFFSALLFGLASEMGQVWVPGRYPSVGDFIFNAAGVILFLIGYKRFNLFNWITERSHA